MRASNWMKVPDQQRAKLDVYSSALAVLIDPSRWRQHLHMPAAITVSVAEEETARQAQEDRLEIVSA